MWEDGIFPRWTLGEDPITDSLVDVRCRVTPDGGSSLIRFDLRGRAPINLKLDIDRMLSVYHEIWFTIATMASRQKMELDRGDAVMRELRAAALEPVQASYSIDPATGNLVAVHSFFNHAPVIFKLSQMAVLENLAAVEDVIRRSRN